MQPGWVGTARLIHHPTPPQWRAMPPNRVALLAGAIIGFMKLPDLERAFVRPEKITRYLLSENHPVGRHKARFFSSFGFSLSSWRQLETALLNHATQHEVAQVEATPFGTAYTVDGPLPAPDGRAPQVRTVWFAETSQTAPYFVTAYPITRAR
jgi:hypothetical protein